MASYQWIKLYDEILDDPKMGRLSDGAYRFCINLFLLASRQEARDGSLPDLCDIAWILRLDEKTATSHLGELVKAEIVTRDGETVTVTKFSDRQGKTETAERMKQYRDRKRKTGKDDEAVTMDETESAQDSYDDVTRRNADIDKKRNEEKREERREEKKTPLSPRRATSPLSDSPADQRVAAICAVCGLDANIPAHRTQAENAAAQLSSYKSDLIVTRYTNQNGHSPPGWNWFRDDWRGRGGEQPTPAQVVETINKKRERVAAAKDKPVLTYDPLMPKPGQGGVY